MKRIIVTALFVLMASSAFAKNAWYWGNITSIRTTGTDGSFEVDLNNQTIKDFCKWDRVYFKVSDMGAERTAAALSLALTAFTSDKHWGVVIDLPETEAVCSASSTASQGAGIK